MIKLLTLFGNKKSKKNRLIADKKESSNFKFEQDSFSERFFMSHFHITASQSPNFKPSTRRIKKSTKTQKKVNQTQPLTFPATRQTRARRCLATLATALAVPLAAGPAVAPATRAALRATGAATTAVKWSAGRRRRSYTSCEAYK